MEALTFKKTMALLHLKNIIFLTILLLCSLITQKTLALNTTVDLTLGFTSLPLNTSSFSIQRPYDIPVEDRYSFVDGVHRMWVYNTDKPLAPTSHTLPRTEIQIHGYDYSTGVWQFEGYGYVPTGTSGVCIMQVFGASQHATTFMLRVYNDSLTYYRAPVLVPNVYDQWFRLNVIHDVDAGKLQVYINGVLSYDGVGRGGKSHYFKYGVYSQEGASYYMESQWKDIKVFMKD